MQCASVGIDTFRLKIVLLELRILPSTTERDEGVSFR